jgi:hypothetical protein
MKHEETNAEFNKRIVLAMLNGCGQAVIAMERPAAIGSQAPFPGLSNCRILREATLKEAQRCDQFLPPECRPAIEEYLQCPYIYEIAAD